VLNNRRNWENHMKAVEVIRGILDIIDQIDAVNASNEVPAATGNMTVATGVDQNRFKQIVDLLSKPEQMYDNSPGEVVASIDSVTVHAGGGWNGPKNPADIRADSVAMYPEFQARPGA
jgi:hypothetical protein